MSEVQQELSNALRRALNVTEVGEAQWPSFWLENVYIKYAWVSRRTNLLDPKLRRVES